MRMKYNIKILRFSQTVKHKTQCDPASYTPRYITKRNEIMSTERLAYGCLKIFTVALFIITRNN